MKVKTLICKCNGPDPYRLADMDSLAFDMDSYLAYAAVHPQLCADGERRVIDDVLHTAEDDPDTFVMVCACAETTQAKLFGKVLSDAEFDPEQFLPIDLRKMAGDGFLGRISERLKELADGEKPCD
jgi:heterodisulfide reductase subunit A-like polyferredoxin